MLVCSQTTSVRARDHRFDAEPHLYLDNFCVGNLNQMQCCELFHVVFSARDRCTDYCIGMHLELVLNQLFRMFRTPASAVARTGQARQAQPQAASDCSPSASAKPRNSTSSQPAATRSGTMTTEADLSKLLRQLTTSPPDSAHTASLLSKAKRTLLHLNALLPTPDTPPTLLALARSVLEEGALLSILAQNPEAFTRYYQQLQPFYELPSSAYPPSTHASESHSQRSHTRSKNDHTHTHGHKHASAQNHEHSSGGGAAGHVQSRQGKITGLYLLLLLTKGDYAAFHTVLEGLEGEAKDGLDGDQYVRYPVMLEQWLMEGAYDRVWGATKREGVPSEEFGVFSEVRVEFSSYLAHHLNGDNGRLMYRFCRGRFSFIPFAPRLLPALRKLTPRYQSRTQRTYFSLTVKVRS